MKHVLPSVVIALSLVVSGGFATLSRSENSAPSKAPAASLFPGEVSLDGGEKALTIYRMTRDGTKVLYFTHSTVEDVEAGVFTEDDVMNITAITIHNGVLSTGVGNRGVLVLIVNGFPHYFAFDGYGATHFTFPTPLPIRADDVPAINVPGGNEPGYTVVYLYGREPVSGDKLLIQ